MCVIASDMYHSGIRSNHLPTMGSAIRNSCKTVMESSWTSDMAGAVDWFWENCSRSMKKTLDTIDRDDATVLKESWELSKTTR